MCSIMHTTKWHSIQKCLGLLLFIIGEYLHGRLCVLGEAWKMPVCLTTSPSQSQQQGPVELLEAGAGTLKETVGGIIFFTLEIHCYNLNLWYRYCETGSHFNGTIRSHKSQAGYLASCGSFKWPTHSTTDKYICLWTRT